MNMGVTTDRDLSRIPPALPVKPPPVANVPGRKGSFRMYEEDDHKGTRFTASSLPVRPHLPNKSHSYTLTPMKESDSNQNKEYRNYRDSFLASRNNFAGKVFGVSLTESLSVASAEVIVQSELVSFGRIPIVVAKCGAYLKAHALETQGIFRIAGNGKRIRELQNIFSSPPDYGSKFSNWDGFTVHDIASLLRRYLNNLEEPLIPLEFYEDFRAPLLYRPRILKYMANRASTAKNTNTPRQHEPQGLRNSERKSSPQGNDGDNRSGEDRENEGEEEEEEGVVMSSIEAEERRKRKARHKRRLVRDIKAAIKDYESLFPDISNDAKQLAIYLLDLLSLFARQSKFNLMTARNLSAVFQPSVLSHPQHDMDPKEYELSRMVTEFLIEYSYDLLPHLLKMAKEEQKSGRGQDTSLMIPQPQKLVIPGNSNGDAIRPITPVVGDVPNKHSDSTSPISDISNGEICLSPNDDAIGSITGAIRNRPESPVFRLLSTSSRATSPLSPHFKSAVQLPKRPRPHSRSTGSAPVPPDVISSNRRRSRLFPLWPRPGFLSDGGDATTTEEEGEEGSCIEDENRDMLPHSPTSIASASGSRPNLLPVPRINRSYSSNSTASSFNKRPMSTVFQDGRHNDSIDELEETQFPPPSPVPKNSRNLSGNSGNHGSGENQFFLQQGKTSSKESIDGASDERGLSSRNKRVSWFQKLKSRSRSGTIS